MSADNWTKCPQCLAIKEARNEKARRAIDKSYGKVTSERFMEMAAAQAVEEAKQDDQTMREDYEIGTDEGGMFTVDYGCSCDTCGFHWSHSIAVSVLA